MLVILLKEDEEEWLNRDIIERERLLQLLNNIQARDGSLSCIGCGEYTYEYFSRFNLTAKE
jgi:hypothetical protein